MGKKSLKYKRTVCIKFSQEEVSSFMKILKEKLYSYLNLGKEESNNHINSINDNEKYSLYYLRFTRYILKEFNSTIVNMIISYINYKSFPKQYKNQPNFIYKIINILKHFFMNEIEIACFTLLLDKIGWNNKKFEQWLYFKILGILSKNLCGNENDLYLLMYFFSRNNPEFTDIYSAFMNDKDIISKINEDEISIKQINKRFILLTKPINTYCQKNFINIEGLLDEIVKTSQTYLKGKSKHKLHKKIIKQDTAKRTKAENTVKANSSYKKEKDVNFIENTNDINQINFSNIKELKYNLLDSYDINLDNNTEPFNLRLSNFDSLNSFKFKDILEIN